MTEQKKQKLILQDRKSLALDGVNNIIAFDAEYVRLATVLGDLLIKGSDLSISSLVIERGELQVSGYIDSIAYFESGTMQKGAKKAIKRLLK
ncbi:MAG: sporulation protein YabP [Firmicutes bacterium]|nr:sporulation protein YabP [Bacillota bacterium]